MRFGVLGGTFDPIHYGHLVIAEEARVCLKLARVIFVPARESPHKPQQSCAPDMDRLRMVELAIAGNPGFAASDVDLARPAPSYTVDTLALLQKQLGPQAELYFIMGTDSLAGILTWREPERILSLARLAVAVRPGYEADLQSLEGALPGIWGRTHFLHTPDIGVSSHGLRQRVREGHPIRYQLPETVEAYIREHGLYLDGPAPAPGAGCP